MEYSFAIIDSDAASNLQLQLMLEEYNDFVNTGTVKNPKLGLDHILKYSPDIVLVNLNDQYTFYFQLVTELHQYMNEMPLLIAFSNTKKYAYEALKNGFFDYWLLPHDEFEIRKTIYKLRKQVSKTDGPTKICLRTYKDYHYIDTKDILYLKSDNNATDFFMTNGSVVNAYKTLKSFEDLLPTHFIRIHQSYILNTHFVSRINYGKNTCSLKIIENTLPFSKTYIHKIDALKQLLSKNSIPAVE